MARVPAYSTILSTRALKEITEAWNWYEDRQAGLGDLFLNEVRARMEKIEQTPERYPARYRSYKETPIQIFPFLIIYRINKRKKLIRIVSVFHTSLNPKKKY
jgi:plasmid stabilization system protein ParE